MRPFTHKIDTAGEKLVQQWICGTAIDSGMPMDIYRLYISTVNRFIIVIHVSTSFYFNTLISISLSPVAWSSRQIVKVIYEEPLS